MSLERTEDALTLEPEAAEAEEAREEKEEAEETEEGREVVCGFGLGRAVACAFISEYELGFECECECGFGFGFE